MKRKNLSLLGVACAAAVFAGQAHRNAVDEIKRLAALMEWKPGTVAADIGAGEGEYTFAAGGRSGAAGKGDGGGEEGKKTWGPRGGACESKQGGGDVGEREVREK